MNLLELEQHVLYIPAVERTDSLDCETTTLPHILSHFT